MTRPLSSALTVREAVSSEQDSWDQLVQGFPEHRVVHTRGWLTSLEESRLGKAYYLVCEKDGCVVGCWPGILVKYGPFQAFGSPPPKSQTASMGPLFDSERVSTHELMAACMSYLEQRFRVQHFELISGVLDADQMRELGFDGNPVKTHRIALSPGNEEEVFRQFNSNARRNVRRAKKLNLEVRFATEDSLIDEAYGQFKDAFVRGGHSVTFGKGRAAAFFRNMKAAGKLLAATVHLPNGPCIATGLFTVHGRELLLWQWAYRAEFSSHRPTELMTWEVMKRAMSLGCNTCDLMGGGGFKKKFGAREDFSQHRWMRSRSRFVQGARRLGEAYLRKQMAWRGQLAKYWSLFQQKDVPAREC